ncbi:hypothetical protein LBMAG53_35210 [Planctomycetota bacterium]|nr:hypothetical protein LBMAG53_35210 [Planctomycetota bacterium]
MGGNALKHLHPIRLTSAEVVALVHHLHRNWQLVDARPLYLVPWVAEKQDHGDIDLICESNAPTVERFAGMIGAHVAAISRNDKVLSVPVPVPWDRGRIVQVDFICCATAEAPATRFFYAGGDFGMLIGRVAAWQGLVFGMDGLRYRAERDVPWAADVHLTADPSTVLTALGYPAELPWFDTYDTLWRFVLSSPLAGPWMFMPEATNHENRSRDKQRRKVGDFQSWLSEHFSERLSPPAPRRTPAEARDWVRKHFPAIGIDEALHLQEARFAYAKLRTRLLGLGAAQSVLSTGHPPELLGKVVHDMQVHLPDKATREEALASPHGWDDMIGRARAAAALVAAARGLETCDPGALPEFQAPPSIGGVHA